MHTTYGPIRLDAWLRGENIPATVLATYSPRPLVELPVVNITCTFCRLEAMPGTPGVEVCRVRGDSMFGYEGFHASCQEAFYAGEAEQDAYELACEQEPIVLTVTYLP